MPNWVAAIYRVRARLFRWGLAAFLLLVVLVAILYVIENIKGYRAWREAKELLRSRGQPMCLEEVIPPPVPDDENMAMAPIWVDLFEADAAVDAKPRRIPRINQLQLKREKGEKGNSYNGMPFGTNLRLAKSIDLSQWRDFLLPKAVINKNQSAAGQLDIYLSRSEVDSVVLDVRDSLRRPTLRWPYDYEKAFVMRMPPLSPLLDTAKFLQLRSVVLLERKKTTAAGDDYRTLYQLAGRCGHEPGLIHVMIADALDGISDQMLWEGLQRGGWKDAELAEWQDFVHRRKPLSKAIQALRGERAVFFSAIDQMSANEFMRISQIWDGGVPGICGRLFFNFRPAGWVAQDKALSARDLQAKMDRLLTIQRKGHLEPDYPERAKNEEEIHLCHPSITSCVTPMSSLALPGCQSFCEKMIDSEASRRNALVAVAIERYRLKHGKNPAKLEALVPNYLDEVPLDIIDGESLRFHPVDNVSYVIYSLGWNGRDDGGKTGKSKYSGDWIWPSGPGLVGVEKGIDPSTKAKRPDRIIGDKPGK